MCETMNKEEQRWRSETSMKDFPLSKNKDKRKGKKPRDKTKNKTESGDFSDAITRMILSLQELPGPVPQE